MLTIEPSVMLSNWLPAPLETRAVASLTLGPLVGTAIHATTLLRATRRP